MIGRMIRNLKETIISPSTAYPRIAEENELKLAAWVVCLTAVVACLTEGLDPIILAGAILAVLLGWQIETGLIHLTARMLGAHGRRCTLLIGNAYAMTPVIYLTPLYLIGADGLAGTIGSVWSLCLNILALKSAYSIGTGKAVGVMVMFYVILFVICGVLVFSGALDGILPEVQEI